MMVDGDDMSAARRPWPRQALLLTVCLAPLTAAAVFVSGFRFALGLCCCSPLFWCVRTLISKPRRTSSPNKP